MTTARPPDEVFCMTCGPSSVLGRDPRAPVLRCRRCGDSLQVPALPLFVVTGASGARKMLGPIHFCNLDCSADVLAERLRARPSWRWRHGSIETAVLEHQRFAAWLRTHIEPCFDTSTQAPEEVAEHVAAWIRDLCA